MKQCSINIVNDGSERSIERSIARPVVILKRYVWSYIFQWWKIIITIIGCKIEINGSGERYRDS